MQSSLEVCGGPTETLFKVEHSTHSCETGRWPQVYNFNAVDNKGSPQAPRNYATKEVSQQEALDFGGEIIVSLAFNLPCRDRNEHSTGKQTCVGSHQHAS
jgi:hypothetical protein